MRQLFTRRKTLIFDNTETAFMMNVQTDNAGTSNNDQFTIPINAAFAGSFNYNVETSDGQSFTNQTGNLTITFPSDGNYDVSITGDFPAIRFNNLGDKLKLLDIKSWGIIAWGSFSSAFRGCNNMTSTATDTPDLSNVTDMGRIFLATSFNSPVINWDVSNITTFIGAFVAAPFNQDVSSWDTSNVTDMNNMFEIAIDFDQDVSSWDINQVTTFGTNFMRNVTLSTANYDALLIAWDAQGSMSFSGTVNFGFSKYTSGGAAETARTSLISKWGAIIDGGAA